MQNHLFACSMIFQKAGFCGAGTFSQFSKVLLCQEPCCFFVPTLAAISQYQPRCAFSSDRILFLCGNPRLGRQYRRLLKCLR